MKLVTVFGASGRMGQAQVRQLLLAGYQVRAITRKKGVFKDENVTEVSADYNDPESLDNAIEGADADYGYVGTGIGKITLYKEKEVVQRNIHEAEAVDALIELIRSHGDWVEPSV